jgi:hypothetical protein
MGKKTVKDLPAMSTAKKDASGKIKRLPIRALASQQAREVKGGALNTYVAVIKGKKQG